MRCKYETHIKPHLYEIECWCREGLIEKEICKRLGISIQTLNKYKHRYGALVDALKNGRSIADYRVEDALFKRATGYDYEDVVIEKDKAGNATAKKIKKSMPPDVTACIFWLKNRRSDRWRNSDIPAAANDDSQLNKLAEAIDKSRKELAAKNGNGGDNHD